MLQIVGRLGNSVSLLTAGSSALSLSLSSKSRDPHPLRSLAPWRYCSWFPARIMGNCHPDGRHICGRLSLALAWKIAISISLSISISIRGTWDMQKHVRRYCCCLRCVFRVSRTGYRHPSIGDVAGSTTQPVSEGDIRPGCVWSGHLDCPLFCAPGGCVTNCLSLNKARPTSPLPTSAGITARKKRLALCGNCEMPAEEF